MPDDKLQQPVDYLIIGHLTNIWSPAGSEPGGPAAYAGRTAAAMGLRVGLVSAWGPEIRLARLHPVGIAGLEAERSTTFERITTAEGRSRLKIRHVAPDLDYHLIPDRWRAAPIVHLAPCAREVAPTIVRHFSDAYLGVTPRGWLIDWRESGEVYHCEWPEAAFVLNQVDAAVVNLEDLEGDERRVDEMAAASRLLAVLRDDLAVRVFWEGEVRRFDPPDPWVTDPDGISDVFAPLFFIRAQQTQDPWEAARFATKAASRSATRSGLERIPTPAEIQASLAEFIF